MNNIYLFKNSEVFSKLSNISLVNLNFIWLLIMLISEIYFIRIFLVGGFIMILVYYYQLGTDKGRNSVNQIAT